VGVVVVQQMILEHLEMPQQEVLVVGVVQAMQLLQEQEVVEQQIKVLVEVQRHNLEMLELLEVVLVVLVLDLQIQIQLQQEELV